MTVNLDVWLLVQVLSLPLTRLVFRTLLVGLAALGNFRGEDQCGIVRFIPRRGFFAVVPSASAAFRDTLTAVGLVEKGETPVPCLERTGLTRI